MKKTKNMNNQALPTDYARITISEIYSVSTLRCSTIYGI